jgi:hypothetical protein
MDPCVLGLIWAGVRQCLSGHDLATMQLSVTHLTCDEKKVTLLPQRTVEMGKFEHLDWVLIHLRTRPTVYESLWVMSVEQ